MRGLPLRGFLGESDRNGYRRLYFTRNLDYYAEFAVKDVLGAARIPQNRLPFLGEDATEITLKAGARLEYTRSRAVRIPDEFDLDFRLIRRTRNAPRRSDPRGTARADESTRVEYTCDVQTCAATCGTCEGGTCEGTCEGYTCEATACHYETCLTCGEATCDTLSCWPACISETCPGDVTCPDTGDCTPSKGYTDTDPCHGPSDIDTVCETCGYWCEEENG